MNWRKIFVISVIAICIISINLAVYLKIIEKDDHSGTSEEIIVDTVALTENFENIFDNTIDLGESDLSSVSKIEETQKIVYSKYEIKDKKENSYDIEVNIPYLNINHEIANTINQEIDSLFYSKVNSLLTQNNSVEIIYNVKYKAYINDNILSLVIRSTLKEGTNAQRLIIKTYNYNLSSNQILDIHQLLDYRKLDENKVQSKIKETIETASSTASAYQKLGYSTYLRNPEDDMYLLENTNVYFLGAGKSLYILYPYGNSNYTSEMDLLVM